MYVYLVVDTTPFELPIGVFDSVRECAEFLSVPIPTCRKAVERSSVLRGFCRVYKILLEV